MLRIILDTNMLLVPGQFNVDIFSEIERVVEEPYELVVLGESMQELERLAQGNGEDGRAAKLAKLLLEQQAGKDRSASKCKGLKIIPGSGSSYADDAIVAIAEEDTMVATNDGGLKRRLLERGTRVIFLKQQQYLTISA